jgi:hypothetical protein
MSVWSTHVIRKEKVILLPHKGRIVYIFYITLGIPLSREYKKEWERYTVWRFLRRAALFQHSIKWL